MRKKDNSYQISSNINIFENERIVLYVLETYSDFQRSMPWG